jgi:hypothetical protein
MWPRTDSVKLPGVALSGGFATIAQVSAQLRSAIRHGAGLLTVGSVQSSNSPRSRSIIEH